MAELMRDPGQSPATGRIARLRRPQTFLLLLSLLLLWPALVNGGAFYFSDTTAYIRGVDAALDRAMNWRSEWTDAAAWPAASAAEPVVTTVKEAGVNSPVDAKPVLLGRSFFYGAIAFLRVVADSDWAPLGAQAMITGAVLIGFIRHFVDPRRKAFTRTCVFSFVLLTATSLPFFVSMLMPDFITGVSLIVSAALVAGWNRESGVGRFFWFAVIAAASLMHSSNILILLIIATSALVAAALARDGGAARGGAVVAVAALFGFLGEAGFAYGVTRTTGAAPIRPPFVAARLIEDGPGLTYLDRTCPASGFLLCGFRERMPSPSDNFLWSGSQVDGVFSASPPATRRALSEEHNRFVLAVVASLPLEVADSSIRAAGRQFAQLGLEDFNYPRGARFDRLPASVLQEIASTRAYNRTMPLGAVEMLLWPGCLLSIAIILAACAAPGTRRSAKYGAVIVLGWLANNVVCGALSTPHERYQARVVWALPLVAALIMVRTLREKRSLIT